MLRPGWRRTRRRWRCPYAPEYNPDEYLNHALKISVHSGQLPYTAFPTKSSHLCADYNIIPLLFPVSFSIRRFPVFARRSNSFWALSPFNASSKAAIIAGVSTWAEVLSSFSNIPFLMVHILLQPIVIILWLPYSFSFLSHILICNLFSRNQPRNRIK